MTSDPLMGLRRQVRVFLETDLFGVVPWGAGVAFDAPEPSEPEELVDGDGNPVRQRKRDIRRVGRWKEHVIARFSGFVLEISSPNQQPPLGLIRLHGRDGSFGLRSMVVVEGPMARETWDRVAAYIRGALATEDENHGSR